MSNAHIISFFGQNTGIIIKSASKFNSFMFIQCIKKNQHGKWEKPTFNQGRTIKFTLEEMIMILQVLYRKTLNWKSFHTYNEKTTPFSFSWEDEEAKVLWVTVADYSKVLNFAQVEIFRLLLRHLVEEKIIYSTSYTKKNSINNDNSEKELIQQIEHCDELHENEQITYEGKNDILKNMTKIKATLAGETEKAILLNFGANESFWIPKSSIYNQYLPRKNFNQFFLIDNWVLEKNNIHF